MARSKSAAMRPSAPSLVQKVVEYGLLMTGMSAVFFFSGVLLGWAPFMHALLQEGQYEELCHNETRNSTHTGVDGLGKCNAQLNQLNLIFTLGSAAISASSLPSGLFLDMYGPRLSVAVSMVFELSGIVLLAYADSQTFDVFIPAVLCIAVGGLMIMLCAFPISFRFPGRQAAILATISCLFDASSVVFAAFNWGVRKHYSRKSLLFGYGIFCAVNYVLLLLFWTCARPTDNDGGGAAGGGGGGADEDGIDVDSDDSAGDVGAAGARGEGVGGGAQAPWSGSVQGGRRMLMVAGGATATTPGGRAEHSRSGGGGGSGSGGGGGGARAAVWASKVNTDRRDRLSAMAAQRGATAAEVAVAYALRSGATSVVVGASSVPHLHEAARGSALGVTDADARWLRDGTSV